MHAHQLLVTAAAVATVALGQMLPQATQFVARQVSDECIEQATSLASDMPNLTGELAASYTQYSRAHPTGVLGGTTWICSFATALPSSLRDDFAGYASGLVSFASKDKSQIIDFYTSCVDTNPTDAPSISSDINGLATATNLCGITNSPTSSPNAAMPKPTGLVAGAAAAAALIGGVAML
ncbi:Uu.00g141180.m01.CDS01 [Anthostomella pinea]|uniref:Uu.00g141180.m01.CDS01 n=1 Tax=Anthostomella pinea TaxID=933095 RepID=A0AAI8YLF1_9PEZI|nr:Uu.00g141180.m01.CDS01 [Anthostomella pinea]